MIATGNFSPSPYDRTSDQQVPAQRSSTGDGQSVVNDRHMWARAQRPDSRTVRVNVYGDLDAVTTPRLEELLGARVRAEIDNLDVDVSELHFLGLAGVCMLHRVSIRAGTCGITLRIVAGDNRPARRAFQASGLDQELPIWV